MNIKLFDYQLKAGNQYCKTTICNWSRGLGKNYTLAAIILDEKPDHVMYISNEKTRFTCFFDKIKEVILLNNLNKYIDCIYMENYQIIIKYKSGNQTIIFNWFDLSQNQIQRLKSLYYDLVIYDDLLPNNEIYTSEDWKYTKIISMVTMNNYNSNLETRFKTDAIILNEDYKIGLKYNLYNNRMLEESKQEPDWWFNQFAIMDNPSDKKDNNDLFNENIILNLKNELECLGSKIQIARSNNEFGTYKNLIMAFKEVLGLYKEMTESKKYETINYSFNIDTIEANKIDPQIISKALARLKEELYKKGSNK